MNPEIPLNEKDLTNTVRVSKAEHKAKVDAMKAEAELKYKEQQELNRRIKYTALGVLLWKIIFALIAPFITVAAIGVFAPSVTLTIWTYLAAFWFHYFLNVKLEVDFGKLVKK